VCADCPVIESCRRHALEVQEQYGVWGGLSEEERLVLLNRGRRSLRRKLISQSTELAALVADQPATPQPATPQPATPQPATPQPATASAGPG
jgi:WhiB family redox-sensing transcriptional regulator